MRRSLRMRRGLGPGALAMLLVFALAAMAIGYALWFQVLTINSVVQTGNVHAAFTKAFTDDDDVPDDPARDAGDNDDCADLGGVDIDGDSLTSCDPAASEDGVADDLPGGPGPEPRHDKDVARCDASVDAADSSVGHIRKRNVYPGYFCTAWFEIHNDGSIPVKLARVLVNGKLVTPSQPTPFDLNGDGRPDIEVHITGLQSCVQIEPGEKVLMDVDQQILQGAPQGVLLQYSVRVMFAQWNEQCPPTPAVFDVTGSGVSPAAASALATALNLPSDPLAPDGSLLFVDPARFQALPMMPAEPTGVQDEDGQETTAEAINFDALSKLTVPSDEEVLSRFSAALEKSSLVPSSDFGVPAAGHSMAEVTTGEDVKNVSIDSQVNYSFHLQGIPLIGPGQKIKASWDSEGVVSQLFYASRSLRQGEAIPVLTPEEAQAQCMALFQRQQPGVQQGSFDVFADLVYYAPPLEMKVEHIYPHFQCGGTAMVGDEQVQLKNTLIPAVKDSPQVELTATAEGGVVFGEAKVAGGTPPYTFFWSSSTTPLPPELATGGPTIEYQPIVKEDTKFPETLTVLVTDANALTGSASQSVQIIPGPIGSTRSLGRVDVGTEWIGSCGGLGGSAGNAAGFVNTSSAAGIPVEFNWGEFNAWERDFKESTLGGDDSNWVDNVDSVFYTGHANGNGWVFCSSMDDTFLDYTEARFGNRDLEWLVIAACGPLQLSSDGLTAHGRWFRAFRGLHMLMGYANVSQDNTIEGQTFAGVALGQGFPWSFIGPQRIRTAWAWAAILSQPSSVTYGYMYVFDSNGVSNYNDYFWGKGPTGPDILSPVGSVVVRSPS